MTKQKQSAKGLGGMGNRTEYSMAFVADPSFVGEEKAFFAERKFGEEARMQEKEEPGACGLG
jgi:hypothetical protein